VIQAPQNILSLYLSQVKCQKYNTNSKLSIEASFVACSEIIKLCDLLNHNPLHCMLTTPVLYILQLIPFTMDGHDTFNFSHFS